MNFRLWVKFLLRGLHRSQIDLGLLLRILCCVVRRSLAKSLWEILKVRNL